MSTAPNKEAWSAGALIEHLIFLMANSIDNE